MADRAYIIPLRNDLAGAGVYLRLAPIAGQKSSTYDGEHQDCYVRYGIDVPGTTTTAHGAYVSGSLSTTPLAALVVVDTDGNMVNDASVTANPEFGLAAYLQERVTNAVNEPLPLAECARAVREIQALLVDGADLAAKGINDAISEAVKAIASGVADTYSLTGGDSFGTVQDVMRILSGEAYKTPEDTIIADQANVFLGLAARGVLVAAAIVAGNTQYGTLGAFLESDEPGYRPMPELVPTGSLKASTTLPGGELYTWGSTPVSVLNSGSFAYTAAAVDAWHPRAQAIQGNGTWAAIPATGAALCLRVYDQEGTCIRPVI
jgi:hypothetical protein